MAVERTLARRRLAWAERFRVAVRNPARTAAYAIPAMVLVALLARVWLSRKIATPWILSDELTYSELADSFASCLTSRSADESDRWSRPVMNPAS